MRFEKWSIMAFQNILNIVAQKSGDLQTQNFMRPSARLLIYAMWPPVAHEFDTPGLEYLKLYIGGKEISKAFK